MDETKNSEQRLEYFRSRRREAKKTAEDVSTSFHCHKNIDYLIMDGM